MKTCQLYEIKQNGRLHIDNINDGATIEGPATVIVIKEEAAAGTTAQKLSDDSQEPKKFVWGESIWDNGSVWG